MSEMRMMKHARCLFPLFMAIAVATISSPAVAADEEKALAKALSAPFDVVADANRSYRPLFDAIMKMTPPPAPIGPAFNATTIWPGMTGWAKVAEWAKANGDLKAAMVKAQNAVALAVPYGTVIDAKYIEAGLCVRLGDGRTIASVDYPYLDRMTLMAAFATAEMYRLGEAGDFDGAFEIALANLRILRQGCDQRTIREKSFFMETLADGLSVNRDFMWTYLDKISGKQFQEASLKGYAFLRQTDLERLRRLEMPEGDRAIQLAALRAAFAEDGQADPDRFAAIWGPLQAKDLPLSRFGAAKFWRLIANFHGSIDASEQRLVFIYDDWWRRWRMRPFDPIQDIETVLSKTNSAKYAALLLTVTDMKATFDLRQRLIVEVNGTALAAGLSAFKRINGNWPADIARIFPIFAMKRLNYDPWRKYFDSQGLPDNGPINYQTISRPLRVATEWGEILIEEFVLYAMGFNLTDENAAEHSRDGKLGDLVLFPAPRALARKQGKLE